MLIGAHLRCTYLNAKNSIDLPTTQELRRVFKDRVARPRSIGAIDLQYWRICCATGENFGFASDLELHG